MKQNLNLFGFVMLFASLFAVPVLAGGGGQLIGAEVNGGFAASASAGAVLKVKDLFTKRQALLDARISAVGVKAAEAREKALLSANDKLGKLEGKISELKAKAEGSAETKAELDSLQFARIDAFIDQRISVALKLEAKGADSALVKDFVDFAQEKKSEFANQTSLQAKKEAIVALNLKWRQFSQSIANDVITNRFEASLTKSADLLVRMNSVIAVMKQKGFDVSVLENQSARLSLKIAAAADESLTVKQAAAELGGIKSGLMHLKNSIQKTVSSQAIRELPAEAKENEESVKKMIWIKASSEVSSAIRAALGLSLHEGVAVVDSFKQSKSERKLLVIVSASPAVTASASEQGEEGAFQGSENSQGSASASAGIGVNAGVAASAGGISAGAGASSQAGSSGASAGAGAGASSGASGSVGGQASGGIGLP